MKLIVLTSTDPYLNLAIEEYLFDSTEEDIVMLWRNEPSVILGKNQNAYAEINFDYVKENNIKVARRITGGGAVYHDLDNVNYTFISVNQENASLDFAYFTKPVLKALNTIGIDAVLSGRNDIEVLGKKISGNAQCTRNGKVLHHGTLLFDSELDVLSSALKVDESKIKTKAVKSVKSRVTNIKELQNRVSSTEEFLCLLKKHFSDEYKISESRLEISESILELTSRNKSDEWIFPRRDLASQYSLKKKKKYDYGIVEIYIEYKNSVIKNIKVCGDFFSLADISEIEEILKGKSIEKIPSLLSNIDVGKYIFGMSSRDLIDLILDK